MKNYSVSRAIRPPLIFVGCVAFAAMWSTVLVTVAMPMASELVAAAIADFGDGFFSKLITYALIALALWAWVIPLPKIFRFLDQLVFTEANISSVVDELSDIRLSWNQRKVGKR